MPNNTLQVKQRRFDTERDAEDFMRWMAMWPNYGHSFRLEHVLEHSVGTGCKPVTKEHYVVIWIDTPSKNWSAA